MRVGLFSITPCSNHSRAILFMWLMAKKTLDSLEENCWGYELNVRRLLGFKPSKVSGGLIRVCWVGGADEGGGGGGGCPTWLNALMSCSTSVVVLAGGGGSSCLMGGNGAASAGKVSGSSTVSVSSSIEKHWGNGNLHLNNELKIPGACGLVIGGWVGSVILLCQWIVDRQMWQTHLGG